MREETLRPCGSEGRVWGVKRRKAVLGWQPVITMLGWPRLCPTVFGPWFTSLSVAGARGGDWSWPCITIKSRFYKNSWTWKRHLMPRSLQTGSQIFIEHKRQKYRLFGGKNKMWEKWSFALPSKNSSRTIPAHYHSESWDMAGIFHACLEFMNRKIGLISFLTEVFVNKHVKSSCLTRLKSLWVEPGLTEGVKTATKSIKRPGHDHDPWWAPSPGTR